MTCNICCLVCCRQGFCPVLLTLHKTDGEDGAHVEIIKIAAGVSQTQHLLCSELV